jgi:TPR repeat protein
MQVVILQSRYNEDEWCVRVQRGSGLGRYLKLTWRSLEAARLWTERSIARNKAVTMFVARLLVSAILLAFIALPSTASADPFEDGASAFERGDYDTALQIWRPLADHDPRAAVNLGVMYAEGLGVQKDAVEALRWLGPAALAGDPSAQMHLGVMLAEGIGGRRPNYEAAAAWYRAAADQGYPDAQVLLGFAYSIGEGVPEDYVAAHMWANLAAAKLPPGKARDAALQLRDQLADKMTPAQITDAQKLAREWEPKGAAPPPAKP